MPTVIVKTNVRTEDIPREFEENVSKKVTEVLGTSPERMVLWIDSDKRMTVTKNLDMEPSCFIRVMSVTALEITKIGKVTEMLLPFFSKELNISQNRITILYQPLERHNLGFHWDAK